MPASPDLRPASDERLIVLCYEGDAEAFKTLYTSYFPRLCGLANAICRDRAAAEDIAEETFLVVARGRIDPSVRFRVGSFPAWLFKIARNKALDFARRRARHREEALQGTRWDSAFSAFDTVPSNAASPEHILQAKEAAAALHRCMGNLRSENRELLYLVADGWDFGRLELLFGIGRGALMVRASRARDKLARCLEESTGESRRKKKGEKQ